jgi:hypothetical protein
MSKIKPANIHEENCANIRPNNGQLHYDRDSKTSQEDSKEPSKIYFENNKNREIGELPNTIKCTKARIRFKRARDYAFKESGARKVLIVKD